MICSANAAWASAPGTHPGTAGMSKSKPNKVLTFTELTFYYEKQALSSIKTWNIHNGTWKEMLKRKNTARKGDTGSVEWGEALLDFRYPRPWKASLRWQWVNIWRKWGRQPHSYLGEEYSQQNSIGSRGPEAGAACWLCSRNLLRSLHGWSRKSIRNSMRWARRGNATGKVGTERSWWRLWLSLQVR